MDDVLDRLRRLPDTPPTRPEPLEGLRRRARRRRHRHRLQGGVAAALVVTGSIAAFAGLGDRRPSPVAVEIGDQVTVPATPTTAATTTAPATTTTTNPVSVPGREAAWRIPASIGSSFLPRLVGAEAAGDLILVPGAFDAGGMTAYDASTGTQRWRSDVGTSAFVVAVGDGLVVLAPQHGSVSAVDLSTGRPRWQVELPAGASAGRGTVDAGRVYLGASHTSEGAVDAPFVLALDASTGRTIWRTTLDAATQLQPAAPVVAGGLVVVADAPAHPGSAPTSHLHALDASTGAARWRADLGSGRAAIHEQAPVVSGGTVYAASNAGHLLALDSSSGRERWRHQSPSFVTLVAVVDEQVLAVSGGHVVSLDRANGRLRWQVPTSAPGRPARSWAVLSGGTLVVAEPGRTFAVDVASGGLRWELGVDAWNLRAHGDALYLALPDRLLTFDIPTGRPAWGGEVTTRRDQAPFVAGDAVVVTAADGALVGFRR
jgi:outer membrane protein assembly factor BamB